MKLKKQLVFIFISISILLLVIISTSYASFSMSSKNYNRQITSGSLEIDYQKNSNRLPIAPIALTDDESKNLQMYTFDITNKGTIKSNFKINLQTAFLDDFGPRYLKYKLYKKINNEFVEIDENIINNSNINILREQIESNEQQSYGIKIWVRSSLPNEYYNKNINIDLNIKSQIISENRGLKEAIFEDNDILSNVSLQKELYDITKSSADKEIENTIYGTTYSFDENTGIYSLKNVFDVSSSNISINKTFTCENNEKSCNKLYFIKDNKATVLYHSIKTPIYNKGLLLSNNKYTFLNENNYISINDELHKINEIDEYDFITLSNNKTYNLNDLTVSGSGEKSNPYKIID